mmetsp:Transcript_9341/g.25250  ORF Transcript_9341/g.25250 Transcript_9341/m.25250 type:complete len:212 (-) Transcript_9341:549-1184(-)
MIERIERTHLPAHLVEWPNLVHEVRPSKPLSSGFHLYLYLRHVRFLAAYVILQNKAASKSPAPLVGLPITFLLRGAYHDAHAVCPPNRHRVAVLRVLAPREAVGELVDVQIPGKRDGAPATERLPVLLVLPPKLKNSVVRDAQADGLELAAHLDPAASEVWHLANPKRAAFCSLLPLSLHTASTTNISHEAQVFGHACASGLVVLVEGRYG